LRKRRKVSKKGQSIKIRMKKGDVAHVEGQKARKEKEEEKEEKEETGRKGRKEGRKSSTFDHHA